MDLQGYYHRTSPLALCYELVVADCEWVRCLEGEVWSTEEHLRCLIVQCHSRLREEVVVRDGMSQTIEEVVCIDVRVSGGKPALILIAELLVLIRFNNLLIIEVVLCQIGILFSEDVPGIVKLAKRCTVVEQTLTALTNNAGEFGIDRLINQTIE